MQLALKVSIYETKSSSLPNFYLSTNVYTQVSWSQTSQLISNNGKIILSLAPFIWLCQRECDSEHLSHPAFMLGEWHCVELCHNIEVLESNVVTRREKQCIDRLFCKYLPFVCFEDSNLFGLVGWLKVGVAKCWFWEHTLIRYQSRIWVAKKKWITWWC